jgi:hypothetical protein
MRVNRGAASGGASGGSSELEGTGGMSAPGAGSGQGSQGSGGATRAPSGGGTQREDPDRLGSRTDRGNQNDEDVGSSASRGGGGGEINVPRSGNPGDPSTLDTREHFGVGGGGMSDNPDVTGTTDVDES